MEAWSVEDAGEGICFNVYVYNNQPGVIIDYATGENYDESAQYTEQVSQNYILNISSMWGQVGASCEVHYSVTKAALIGLTRALAKEVGPSGVTVNCIAPGVIDTDMNAAQKICLNIGKKAVMHVIHADPATEIDQTNREVFEPQTQTVDPTGFWLPAAAVAAIEIEV